jgi:pyruvate formate lyase activating enzyme
MKGMVLSIERCSLHDGPGIRTTVFLKGCPLRCQWCHNPHSFSGKQELGYKNEKCIHCGDCAEVCPENAHTLKNGRHTFTRSLCTGCLKCVGVCPTGALVGYGMEMDAESVMDEVRKDRPYYLKSGGGLTLSGGEPLLQYDFCKRLLSLARSEKIHTCVETSGFVAANTIKAVVPDTDIFLYDWKVSDENDHLRYTGVAQKRILENLDILQASGSKVILRCPIIPGINDTETHFDGIISLTHRFKNIITVHILPFHPWGSDKRNELEIENLLEGKTAAKAEEINRWLNYLKNHLKVNVCLG